MPSTKVLVGLFIGVLLIVHPVVGNGPGLDTRYSYSVTEVNISNSEAVEDLYIVPSVMYGTGSQTKVVRDARNGTHVRPKSAVKQPVINLIGTKYVADDVHDHYYRINASMENSTFQLRATRVSEETVAKDVAITPEEANSVIKGVLDGQQTASKKVNATVVRQDNRYLLVQLAESKRVSDPFAIVKIAGYGLGLSLIIGAFVSIFRQKGSDAK